jgi:hypothetical protein
MAPRPEPSRPQQPGLPRDSASVAGHQAELEHLLEMLARAVAAVWWWSFTPH